MFWCTRRTVRVSGIALTVAIGSRPFSPLVLLSQLHPLKFECCWTPLSALGDITRHPTTQSRLCVCRNAALCSTSPCASELVGMLRRGANRESRKATKSLPFLSPRNRRSWLCATVACSRALVQAPANPSIQYQQAGFVPLAVAALASLGSGLATYLLLSQSLELESSINSSQLIPLPQG